MSAKPKVRAYPEMIQDRVVSLAFKLVRMLGSATLTIVASTSAMKKPAKSTASASQEERGAGAKFGRPEAPAGV
jgi:hypothetical protein